MLRDSAGVRQVCPSSGRDIPFHCSVPLPDSGWMRTLLLVVDDAATIGRVRLALRHAAGIQVAATLDGRASIRDELSRAAPDVILVDEMCQRMNTVARLRE